MTLKQKRFADEYIICGNAYKAAIEAGYSENYAKGNVSKLLENVSVKNYLDKRFKEIDSKKIADQEEVLQYLTRVMRGENVSETVVVEGSGDGCSEARRISRLPEERERIKAADLLGKRYGTWTERIDMTADLNITVVTEYEADDSK